MMRRVLIIAAVLVVAAGGAFALYLQLWAPGEGAEEPAAPVDRPVYDVGSITTDLSVGEGGRRNWIQVELQLECWDREALEAVETEWVEIRNELLTILRSSEAESLKGEDGMQRLRSEIIRRTNAILQGPELTDVFVISLVVH